jgi:hypothetical protein
MVYRLAWEPGAMLSSKVAKSRANDDQSRGSTGRREGDDRESYVDEPAQAVRHGDARFCGPSTSKAWTRKGNVANFS